MFEWDEDKRQRNIKEHRVDFRVAVRIFNNPVIESVDEREDYEETRYRALGHDEQQYYMVAYTWRGENRRIISAWKVGENGKKRYENILFGRN